jgi:hypothetical protein
LRYYPASSGSLRSGAELLSGHRFVCYAEVGLEHVTVTVPVLACVDVAPPVELYVTPSVAWVADWDQSREMEILAKATNRTPDPLACSLWELPLAVTDEKYQPVPIKFIREDDTVELRLRLRFPIVKPPLSPDLLIEVRQAGSSESIASARIRIEKAAVGVAEDLTVGLVRGFDPSLEQALRQLAVPFELLGLDEIRSGDRSRFKTILIDSRAYSAAPDLKLLNSRLLDYVSRGGNLVVLFQNLADWSLGPPLSPYALKLGADRIIDETAPVKILEQEHPLMSNPNRISTEDFQGWIVERAVNQPREWAGEYTALIEMPGDGRPPARGCLLVARYGEGTYVYTSLSLNRQLEAAHPGALRLLANLISLALTRV